MFIISFQSYITGSNNVCLFMQLPKRPDGLTCYLTLLTVVVLERSKTEIMSSNLARGMDISPLLLYVSCCPV